MGRALSLPSRVIGSVPGDYLQPAVGHSDAARLVEEGLLALAGEAGMTPALVTRFLEVARGLSYRQMSQLHGISLNTVKTQVGHALASMHVRCCHEIQDTARAARSRAEAGANKEQVLSFLRLRFE